MSDKKGWGSTVAGWFIERDEPETPVETDFGDVPVQPSPAATENYTTPSPTQSVFQKAPPPPTGGQVDFAAVLDRKSTRLNSSHSQISYAVFCLKKKKKKKKDKNKTKYKHKDMNT